MLRLGAVILNGLLECPERINCLLKHLDHRNPAHIFGSGFAHHVLRRLILRHQFGILPAHHRKHRSYRDRCRQKAGSAHPPVKNEHQDNHGDQHGSAADDIRQIVGKKGLRLGGSPIKAVADQTGCIGIKKAKRRLHQMLHTLFADIGSSTERSQVRTHQSREVD